MARTIRSLQQRFNRMTRAPKPSKREVWEQKYAHKDPEEATRYPTDRKLLKRLYQALGGSEI